MEQTKRRHVRVKEITAVSMEQVTRLAAVGPCTKMCANSADLQR